MSDAEGLLSTESVIYNMVLATAQKRFPRIRQLDFIRELDYQRNRGLREKLFSCNSIRKTEDYQINWV